MQSSTCRAVTEVGRAAGREYGLAESTSQELARLLKRQAQQLSYFTEGNVPQFRQRFLGVIARELSWRFTAHLVEDDFRMTD